MQEATERDRHFAGFAKLLYDDLEPLFSNKMYTFEDGKIKEAIADAEFIHAYIARYAYDLVMHSCWAVSNAQLAQGGVCLHPNAMLRAIPDMTAWPESET